MSNNDNELKEELELEEKKETSKPTSVINLSGMVLVTIYLWYVWGQEHDFLSWGFLGYLTLFAIISSIPKQIVMAIFSKDGVFSPSEQIMNVLFNFALVYFLAPVIMGWLT